MGVDRACFGGGRATRGLQWPEVKDWILRMVNWSVGEDVRRSCGIRATLGAGVPKLFKSLNPGGVRKGVGKEWVGVSAMPGLVSRVSRVFRYIWGPLWARMGNIRFGMREGSCLSWSCVGVGSSRSWAGPGRRVFDCYREVEYGQGERGQCLKSWGGFQALLQGVKITTTRGLRGVGRGPPGL